VYKCKEVLDNTVTVIRNALSATPIDKDRLVVGTEEGLYTVDLDRDGEGKIYLHPHLCAL
jgi:serine/threonine-protein kinase MRCK